jgi:hypothetical protein
LQKLSVPHCVQVNPPEPQPLSELPERQVPVAESQQPVQLPLLHCVGAGEEHAAPKETMERTRRKRTSA